MSLDAGFLYCFLLVFCRASAMFLSSPMFGAQNTPVFIRILTTFAISGSLTFLVRPEVGAIPGDLWSLGAAVLGEVIAGLLIGGFCSLVLHACQMGGAFLDIQMGLGSAQTLNPVTGVPVTIISQFKFMLGLVLFLSLNAHHVMLRAFTQSYEVFPTLGLDLLPRIEHSLVGMVAYTAYLSLQIAAPLAAVGFVVDAALGLVNKAAPQMQVFMLGLPAKIGLGLVTISLALPALTLSVQSGVERSMDALFHTFK